MSTLDPAGKLGLSSSSIQLGVPRAWSATTRSFGLRSEGCPGRICRTAPHRALGAQQPQLFRQRPPSRGGVRRRQRGLAPRVAEHAGAQEEAPAGGVVVGPRAVEEAAVVPDDEVSRSPLVLVPRRVLAAGPEVQGRHEPPPLFACQAGDAEGVAAEHEAPAAGRGMDLHQGAQVGFPMIDAVTEPLGREVTDVVCLAVLVRVVGTELGNAASGSLIQSIVCCPHVCKLGLATSSWEGTRRQQPSFG
mmetsp:Transcript_23203/g.65861  ORF Transcript_23203/g.65861 Transcript_23203/m.65861 type:complete len:247 (-) Transcript_23203:360-1100(-)